MEDEQLLQSHEGALPENVLSIAREFWAGLRGRGQDRPPRGLDLRVGARARGLAGVRDARRSGGASPRQGWAVITGGGPGVMEAANRGAKEAGGPLGRLQHRAPARAGLEPLPRHLLHLQALLRPQGLLREARGGFVIFPGGFGTLDELFEALTLIQTGKAQNFPVVLIDTDYWGEMLDWIKGEMLADGMISPEDLDLLHVTDDLDDAVQTCSSATSRTAPRTPRKPRKADAQ